LQRMREGIISQTALAAELGIRRNQLYKWAKVLGDQLPGESFKTPAKRRDTHFRCPPQVGCRGTRRAAPRSSARPRCETMMDYFLNTGFRKDMFVWRL